jgi:hypothetical protein
LSFCVQDHHIILTMFKHLSIEHRKTIHEFVLEIILTRTKPTRTRSPQTNHPVHSAFRCCLCGLDSASLNSFC